jgi:NTE family protein
VSPITYRNYAGDCGFKFSERFTSLLKERAVSERQFYLANNIEPFLDSQKKPYIHLVDGGVADNLGLRAILERIIAGNGVWKLMERTPRENVNKVIPKLSDSDDIKPSFRRRPESSR